MREFCDCVYTRRYGFYVNRYTYSYTAQYTPTQRADDVDEMRRTTQTLASRKTADGDGDATATRLPYST